jgi:hypothetical protein
MSLVRNNCLFPVIARRLFWAPVLAVGCLWFCLPCPGQVFLNEVNADNGGAVVSPGGTSPDYIELCNTDVADVDLSAWTLTDDPKTTSKYQFPPGTVIPAQGFLIVWLDSSLIYPGLVTTNFSLKASGEEVALYQGAVRKDYVKFGPQIKNRPLSRIPDGTGGWMLGEPSPMAANQPVAAGAFGLNAALRLNEWLATNSAGANFDWVEIYNPKTNGIVSLGGLIITDQTTVVLTPPVIPNSFIDSGGFIRFWCDDKTNNGDHLGIKLSSTAGETLTIYQPDRVTIIDRVVFGPQTRDVSMGRLPDGGADIFSFAGVENVTPEGPNAYQPLTRILINEVLTHTDPPLEDAIELYNPTAEAVDISHWWISNDEDSPLKFQVPAGTIIPAGAYAVFYEQNQANGFSTTGGFNRSGTGDAPDFTFNSAHGDAVVLTEVSSSGTLTGFRTSKSLEAAGNGNSFGRYVKSDGGNDFPAMAERTFGNDTPATANQFRNGAGLPNSYPLVGPLVISEILYRPPPVISGDVTNDNTLDEFIELTSVTNGMLRLYDPAYPTNRWRLRGGIEYDFPSNVTLAANATLLIVNFDPATNPVQLASFRAAYGVNGNIPIFGPYRGKLNNLSDIIELKKPDPVQLPPHPDAGFVPFVLVEKLKYEFGNGWPESASGTGYSIQRLHLNGYANDHTNWFGSAPSAGRANMVTIPPAIQTHPASVSATAGSTVSFAVAASSVVPPTFQWRFRETDLPGAVGATLVLEGVQPFQSGNYCVVVSNPTGSVTSQVATLTVGIPPFFLMLPVSQTVSQGTAVSFEVLAAGTEPLAFQWFSNGVSLADQTLPTFTLPGALVTESATYSVMVSNPFGVINASAVLTIPGPPSLVRLSCTPEGAQITLQGIVGQVYEIEATQDFVNWSSLGRFTNSLGTEIFSDPGAANFNHRFYRISLAP